jgi:hypothetical protein
MVDKWLIGLVVSFVLRQLAKFTDKIDWPTLKADWQARAADLIPGTFFDDEAKAITAVVVDGIQSVLSSTSTWETILGLLGAGKTQEALDALLALLHSVWVPGPHDIYALKAKATLAKMVA